MRWIMLSIIALLLLAGCRQNVDSNAIFQLNTYGGFTTPETNRQEIIVEPNKMTIRVLGTNGALTSEISQSISQAQYNKLAKSFSGFNSLKDKYTPTEGVQIADAATGEIILKSNGVEKKVIMDPFVPEFYPSTLKNIANEFMALSEFAMLGKEPQRIATEFVQKSPTFGFDGSSLVLAGHVALESYPVQDVFTFQFTSSHQGYGDRSLKPSAEVATAHEIKVAIVEGKVTSAIIDNKWDDLRQKEIGQAQNPDEPVSNNESRGAWLTFKKMQCVETPWQKWYENGSIQYI